MSPFVNSIKIILLTVALAAAGTAAAQQWELWYRQPARQWVEALPIGNGRLGAMVFGGLQRDRIQFNEETLWTGYPRDYNRKGAYQYLDSIRSLLFAGQQAAAEALAGREFMGLKSVAGDQQAWVDKMMTVLKSADNPSQTKFNDAGWKTLKVPVYDGWEAQGYEGLDGALWFRYSFELPASWAGRELILDLNKIAQLDRTYINGQLVGTGQNDQHRLYKVPAATLHPGTNSIAIFVLNFSGKGGILGYKDTSQHIGLYPADGNREALLSLNGDWKYQIQNDEVPAVAAYQASYQPFGDLYLDFDIDTAKVRDYRRSLDISRAVARTSYTYQEVHYNREYLASTPDQVIGLRLTADQKGQISFAATLGSPHRASAVRQLQDGSLELRVQVKDGALKGVSYLKIICQGGKVAFDNGSIRVREADQAVLWLTANTNYKNYSDITAQPASLGLHALHAIAHKSWTQVQQAHEKEYQGYFNRFAVSFGGSEKMQELPTDLRLKRFAGHADPDFLALYVQYSRYLLISSSRPGTRPANLQGIWNDLLSPPWGSKYTTNINLEMNYWPADILNLSDMQQPLFQMIRELAVTGHETARQYYRAPGWVLHHNTDLWRGTAPINASNHGIWVTGGAWLCDHLWEHYRYSRSLPFLKDTAYPLMKKAALFFNKFLIRDPKTGYLISSPSNSPEQGGLVAGPTMDHQIIRNLFKTVIEASRILGTDSLLRQRLQAQYRQIAPNTIGRYGQLQEWMQDVDDTTNKHRHVSHLWAVYPGAEINWEQTPELMRAARQSLIYRGDAATGWSLGWKINLWARFKDGDHTYQLIRMLLSPAERSAGSYPNLFDAHPPFQIDGNFGGAAGVAEMLMQSHAGYIEMLPALPTALSEGSVRGLKARDGFELDFSWAQGALRSLTVRSTAGAPLQLRYRNKKIEIPTKKQGEYHFNGALELL
ncbi:hypothetical protein GCM10027051_24020 [Niabella terrae]